MSHISISPEWCAKDFTPSGATTWATEVLANLACDSCNGVNLGTFMWPAMDSEIVVDTAAKAIDGASTLALIAARDFCTGNCTIDIV